MLQELYEKTLNTYEGKERPAVVYAEQSLLGAVLAGFLPFEEIAVLPEAAFTLEKHRILFRVCHELRAINTTISTVTVTTRLMQIDKLGAVGGMSYLAELATGVPARIDADYLIGLLDSQSRSTQFLGDVLTEVSRVINGGDYEEAKDKIIRSCQITTTRGTGRMLNPDAISGQDLDQFFGKQTPGIYTGITQLDFATYGLHNGELIILGARPSEGKTALLTQICSRAALDGHNTHIISLEMSKEQLLLRTECQLANVSFHNVRTGELDPQERTALHSVHHALAEAPLCIDDSVDWTVASIRNHLRLNDSQGTPVKLLAIDYLQLMPVTSAQRRDSRHLELGEVTRGLKLLAREFGVAILLLSQLTRGSDRESRKPGKYDLRDSGSIESDADLILLIWHDKSKDKENPDFRTSELILDKQRNGPTGAIPCWFHRHVAKFIDRETA